MVPKATAPINLSQTNLIFRNGANRSTHHKRYYRPSTLQNKPNPTKRQRIIQNREKGITKKDKISQSRTLPSQSIFSKHRNAYQHTPPPSDKGTATIISEAIQSPRFQKRVVDNFTAFQSEVRSLLLPDRLLPSDISASSGRWNHRVGPKMDGRWWSWNILLALSPGILVAVVCESYKGEMEKYYSEQRRRERNRLLGEEEDQKEKTLGIAPDQKQNEDWKYGVGSVVVERVWEAIRMLTMGMSENPNPELAGDAHGVGAGVSVVSEKREEKLDHQSFNDKNVKEGLEEGEEDESVTVQQLLKRVQQLELMIQSSDQAQPPETKDKEEYLRKKNAKLKYQLQRLNQSGVQNRIEDRMMHQWAIEDAAAAADANTAKSNNDSTTKEGGAIAVNRISLDSVAIKNMLQYIWEKGFASSWIESGTEILEPIAAIFGFSSRGPHSDQEQGISTRAATAPLNQNYDTDDDDMGSSHNVSLSADNCEEGDRLNVPKVKTEVSMNVSNKKESAGEAMIVKTKGTKKIAKDYSSMNETVSGSSDVDSSSTGSLITAQDCGNDAPSGWRHRVLRWLKFN